MANLPIRGALRSSWSCSWNSQAEDSLLWIGGVFLFCFDPHHKSKGSNFLISERAGIQVMAAAGLSILTCSQEVHTSPVPAKITETQDDSPAISHLSHSPWAAFKWTKRFLQASGLWVQKDSLGRADGGTATRDRQLCLRRTGRKVPPCCEAGPNLSSTEQSGSGRHLKGEPYHGYAASNAAGCCSAGRIHIGLFAASRVRSKWQSRLRDCFFKCQISNIGSSQSLSTVLVFCGCAYFLFKKGTTAVPGLSHFLQVRSFSSGFLCDALFCIGKHCIPSHWAQKNSAIYKRDLQMWGNKMKESKTTSMMTIHGICLPYLDSILPSPSALSSSSKITSKCFPSYADLAHFIFLVI